MHTLQASGKLVGEICETDNTETAILMAPAVKEITFNENKDIIGFSR